MPALPPVRPDSNIPVSAPQPQVKEGEAGSSIAFEMPVHGPAAKDLANKKITVSPPPKSPWQAIVKFFSRRFSTITPDEKNQAEEITKMASLVRERLDNADKASKVARNAQMSLSSPYPSTASLQIEKTFYDTVNPPLVTAMSLLQKLTEKKEMAGQLADKHASFDSLTDSIAELTKRVEDLQTRIAVGAGLSKLEQKLQKYKQKGTWTNFNEVNAGKRELFASLKTIITDYSAYKDDPFLKKYAAKSELTTTDAYRIISYMHPDLKGHIGRLNDVHFEYSERRVEDVNEKVDTLLPLFSKYKQLSDKVDDLEESLHNKSIFSRIYRLFHRPYTLATQLEHAKTDRNRTLEAIKAKGGFAAGEIEWLKKNSDSNSDLESLIYHMEHINTSLVYLKIKDPISNHVSGLIQILSEYDEAKTKLEAYAGKKDVRVSPEQRNAEALVKKLEQNILSDFRLLGRELPDLYALKEGELPANFDTMETLQQLNVLILKAFPSLTIKTKILSDYLEKHPLKDAIIKAIEEGGDSAIAEKPSVEDVSEEFEEGAAARLDEIEEGYASAQDEEHEGLVVKLKPLENADFEKGELPPLKDLRAGLAGMAGLFEEEDESKSAPGPNIQPIPPGPGSAVQQPSPAVPPPAPPAPPPMRGRVTAGPIAGEQPAMASLGDEIQDLLAEDQEKAPEATEAGKQNALLGQIRQMGKTQLRTAAEQRPLAEKKPADQEGAKDALFDQIKQVGGLEGGTLQPAAERPLAEKPPENVAARDGLLAQIREGKQLKKTEAEPRPKEAEKKTGLGGAMQDAMAKRRKAIADKDVKEGENEQVDDADWLP